MCCGTCKSPVGPASDCVGADCVHHLALWTVCITWPCGLCASPGPADCVHHLALLRVPIQCCSLRGTAHKQKHLCVRSD